jgi:hypothetical protein
MQIIIDNKEVRLKVSMWVVDEDRYNKLVSKRPESKLWQFAALLFICYQNACRYEKTEPIFTADDFEMFVDESYSSKDKKQALVDLTNEITAAIYSLSDGEKIEASDEEKKMIGETSGNLRLANVG